MATSDQLTRAASAQVDFELRFYAGPTFRLARTDNIQAGQGFTPEAAKTTTTAYIDEADTTVPVADTSDFPWSGAILVAPGASDELYEVIAYNNKTSTTFTGLTRSLGGGGGVIGRHTAGADVTAWVEITDYVTGVVTLALEERKNVGVWEVTLGGHAYNSQLIARDRAVLCMWRFRPYDGDLNTWTAWTVGFQGYITELRMDDDADATYRWQAKVASVAAYADKAAAPGLRFGTINLASGATATASSELNDPYLEAGTGEFDGLPDLDADQAIDGEMSTLWCSQNEPVVAELQEYANFLRINEILLAQPVGRQALQFVEVFFKWGVEFQVNLGSCRLVNEDTVWTEVQWSSGWQSLPDDNYIQAGDEAWLDDEGTWGIFVSSRTVFERYWQVVGDGCQVIDWGERMEGTFALDTSSGFVALHHYNCDQADVVWWVMTPAAYGTTEHVPAGYPASWTGSPLALPAVGQTLSRLYPGYVTPSNSADAWEYSNNPTPGGWDPGDDEWIAVDIGAMGHVLADPLAADEFDVIKLDDSLGFTDGGTVVIESEVIDYASADYVNHQLLDLTRPSPVYHAADTLVKQRETWNGAPYDFDCYLVDRVLGRRRPNLPVPAHFAWYVSPIPDPIMPDEELWDDEWQDDWIKVEVEGNTESEFEYEPAAPVRCRPAMLLIHEMSEEGRAKANEIEVIAAAATVLVDGVTGEPLVGARSGTVLKFLLVDQFGLAADDFTSVHDGPVFLELTTTGASYLAVARDLLLKSGCMLVFALDGSCTHDYHPAFPLSSMPAIEVTWDRANTRAVELDGPAQHNVSQVILRATLDKSGDVIEVRFPGQALALGEEKVVEGRAALSPLQALQLAEMIWRQENGPYNVILRPAGIAEFVMPGQRHVVDWTLDSAQTLLSGRNFVVKRVTHTLTLPQAGRGSYVPKRWDTTIALEEVWF